MNIRKTLTITASTVNCEEIRKQVFDMATHSDMIIVPVLFLGPRWSMPCFTHPSLTYIARQEAQVKGNAAVMLLMSHHY